MLYRNFQSKPIRDHAAQGFFGAKNLCARSIENSPFRDDLRIVRTGSLKEFQELWSWLAALNEQGRSYLRWQGA